MFPLQLFLLCVCVCVVCDILSCGRFCRSILFLIDG
jgi:hypothetical protein